MRLAWVTVCVLALMALPMRAQATLEREALEQVVTYVCREGVQYTHAPSPSLWHTQCTHTFKIGEVAYLVYYDNTLDFQEVKDGQCLALHPWCQLPWRHIMLSILYPDESEEVIVEDQWGVVPTLGLFRPHTRKTEVLYRYNHNAGMGMSPVGEEHYGYWAVRFKEAMQLLLQRITPQN